MNTSACSRHLCDLRIVFLRAKRIIYMPDSIPAYLSIIIRKDLNLSGNCSRKCKLYIPHFLTNTEISAILLYMFKYVHQENMAIYYDPLNPFLYSKTGVYIGIHYFSYFCSKH